MNMDFVIVGGGIGGAVLAELLGRGGKKVVVLEKSSAPLQITRPEVLWPATVRRLQTLIPPQALQTEALLALRGVEFVSRRRTTQLFSQELLQRIEVQPWSTDPGRTRELLLHSSNFELQRGVEVVSILKEGNRVVGVRTRDTAGGNEREVVAPWIVGDDGAYSVVRNACGIPMSTRMFPIDFLCFGFEWPISLREATARAWLNFSGGVSEIFALAAIPLPCGRGAGLVTVRPGIFERESESHTQWSRFRSQDASMEEVIQGRHFPQEFVRVRRPWGHASRYGIEGALLMGDAAHPVSPAGGQGANMSVADAGVLAEAALHRPRTLLEEYERRRRPSNERSIGFTRMAARGMSLPRWLFPASLLALSLRCFSRHQTLVGRGIQRAAEAFEEIP